MILWIFIGNLNLITEKRFIDLKQTKNFTHYSLMCKIDIYTITKILVVSMCRHIRWCPMMSDDDLRRCPKGFCEVGKILFCFTCTSKDPDFQYFGSIETLSLIKLMLYFNVIVYLVQTLLQIIELLHHIRANIYKHLSKFVHLFF